MRWLRAFLSGLVPGIVGMLFAVGMMKFVSGENPDKTGPIILMVIGGLGIFAMKRLQRRRS